MPAGKNSARSGKTTKKKGGRAPSHQNKFAFLHNPKSKLTDKILSSQNVGVCQRCHDKIEWRKKYRKYKPRSQPGVCNLCRRKNVKAAYHTICSGCATSDKAREQAAAASVASRSVKREVTALADDSPEDRGTIAGSIPPSECPEGNGGGGCTTGLESPSGPPNKDGGKEKRFWRVCAMCVCEASLHGVGGAASGNADEILSLEAKLSSYGHGGAPLKLRERKALERKLQNLKEKKTDERPDTKDMAVEVDDEDSEGEENESSDVGSEDLNVDDGECVDDPFLKAVGGVDKLLIGEAYQKSLLETR